MSRSAKKLPASRGRTLLPPTIMLALVRLRKTWGLLLVVGVGIVAAVTLACAVPLYSDVSMTAGLRGALTSSSQNADIVVNSTAEQISPPVIGQATQVLNQEFQDKIGPYLGPPQFSIQTPVLQIDTKISSPNGTNTYKDTDNQLQFFGVSSEQASSHITLVQGRLPRTVSTVATNDDLEIALSTEGANTLKVTLGSIINVKIAGYGFSFYVINAGILDPQLTLLLLSPLTLVGAVFLLIASLLLFLRFFPYMLRFGSWLTSRNRGASPMLALAQMARAPRQSIRMTLLLALATAFAIFTLIFTESQSQRVLDVASFQSGADFSGTIQNSVFTHLQVKERTTLYRTIPGVLSATVGNTSSVTAAGSIISLPMEIRAVDASTFAQTAIWTGQDSSQSLTSLMVQLSLQRASALSRLAVPAVVDAPAWNSLKLSPNAYFTLNFTDGPVKFYAIAQVQHIPTVNDRFASRANNGSVPNGGILVDYPSLARVYDQVFKANGGNLPLNAIWLRTRDDADSLASVRKALTQGELQLNPLTDRRAVIDSIYHEPLYLDLIGVLALGATVALLLALAGNLIASWLSARGRLANFAVLRALGAAPPQIAGTLTWEQCIIYTTSILLGILFGAIFSALVVPQLIFTSVGSRGASSDLTNSQFLVSQSVPPIQIVIPSSLVIALVILVVICIVALGMMVRVVSRPSISQTLRLNED